MAVATQGMDDEVQKVKRKRKSVGVKMIKPPAPKLIKYFGKCEMPNGGTTILCVKALDEAEASRKLHKGYKIVAVIDIVTVEGMQAEWDDLKPSHIKVIRIF